MTFGASSVGVAYALTGAVTSKQLCPAIPYTPVEIAEEAKRAYDAGAAIVHVHARTDQGAPSWDPAVFAATQAGLVTDLRQPPQRLNSLSARYWSDILIEDAKIAAVGHALEATGAEVVDGTDHIVGASRPSGSPFRPSPHGDRPRLGVMLLSPGSGRRSAPAPRRCSGRRPPSR